MSLVDGSVRIGLAGLGRRGAYHLERLALREDFRVVSVFDEPARAAFAARFGCRRHSEWDAFLADGSFDVALIAVEGGGRSQFVADALATGRHVVVEPPLAFTSHDAYRLIDAARGTHRMLGVLASHRGDGGYRTALECLRAGELGSLIEAKFSSWGPVLRTADDEGPLGFPLLWSRAEPLVDQVLQLAASQASRVTARIYGPRGEDGFAATIEFTGGTTATIDCDFRSLAPVQTGWTVIGTRGTYYKGRIYAGASDGEVFDLPAEPLPTDPDLAYVELRERLNAPARWLESSEQHAEVIRTIESLIASDASGLPATRPS